MAETESQSNGVAPDAEQAYCAYGADLIRTGGGLVHTTPSVMYRAATLFQRFQASVSAHYRSCYKSSHGGDGGDALVEYIVPEYAGTEYLPSGLVPLVDLRAPLDYCIHHIVDHEDISYVCAACLLLAAKMEDPGVRIRPIVDAFARLGNRRCGVMVNELLKPPPERYDDFKSCVVKAEEIVLQELGFQTFVEAPHKYAVIYLNLLVDEVPQREPEARAGDGGVEPPHSPAYISWLVAAVQWLNDVPRCRRLVAYSAAALAVCALKHTCPAEMAAQLPKDWFVGLGVPSETMAEMEKTYASYLGSTQLSARTELDVIRATMTRPAYRKASQPKVVPIDKAQTDGAEADSKAKEQDALPGGAGKEIAAQERVSASPPLPASPQQQQQPPTWEGEGEKTGKKGGNEDEEDDDGMDLLALRKKRRREEKERERRERRRKEKDEGKKHR